jgi:hypothetical protein
MNLVNLVSSVNTIGGIAFNNLSTNQISANSIAVNTATFNSNVTLTGGLTSYLSNSGLFSNVGIATFASNVLHTGGASSYLSNSGNLSNTGTGTFYGNITVGTPAAANTITLQTNGTITVPLGTGVGTLGTAASVLLNTANNTAYLGGDYVYLQPAGSINFYRDFYTSWPATFFSTVNISGRLINSGVTIFNSTVTLTGGLTNYLSNSGLFSNAGIARFASNVYLTGGTTTSGLSINNTSNINYLQIHGDTATSQSTAPDGGTNFPLVITSPKTGGSIYAMALGIDYTTGFGFINVAGAGATQPIMLNSRGGNVGVNSTNPSYGLDVNGTFRAVNAATFNSNVLNTGGLTSYLSNSGLFSNVGIATLASNVLHTGGATSYLSNSGLFSNVGQATFAGGVNIVASVLTASNSSNTATFSNATSAANYVVKCEMTGANLMVRQSANGATVAVIENTASGGILLNPIGTTAGYIGINSSNISFPLDVYGIARSAIPVSSISGTFATFGAGSFGIYYYITNSGFSNIALYNTSGGATGTAGTAPPLGTGWYITLRNNTGSYLSITVNGILTSTPASPFVIPPSNATTLAYDSSVSSYIFF